jgi:hypothetical protein
MTRESAGSNQIRQKKIISQNWHINEMHIGQHTRCIRKETGLGSQKNVFQIETTSFSLQNNPPRI